MRLFVFAVLALSSVAYAEELQKKAPKVFSLFNVVQFDNEECKSTSSLASSGTGSSHRNGTCFTEQECSDKGGTAQGSCASGFGVCCVFTLEDGGTINQNCTYIRNPNYPNTYSETNNVQYTVNKCSDNVCFLRLDFENFNIAGPVSTDEAFQISHPCRDNFQVTSNSGDNYPVICGSNSGQHMYVDLGRNPSDSATLTFSFDGDNNNNLRQWEVKVSQIPCGHTAPPAGCMQYHTGLTGRFTTFNYADSTGHLQNQEYSVCIRQEAGFCCVEFQACDEPNSFTLGMGIDPTPTLEAALDTQCLTHDYIGIEASGADCSLDQQNLHSLYCGNVFSPFVAGPLHAPICDCTAPFVVEVFTNDRSDANQPPAATTSPNTLLSRGACLTWMQKPCRNYS